MSENYTKGKLYQLSRSPEIVHAEQGNRGRRICCTESMGDKEVNEANARRIVACWNACDGIPTEKLEKAAGDITPVFQLLTEATAEGIKLRAALEIIAAGNTDPDAMVKLAQEALAANDRASLVEIWRKKMKAEKEAKES